MRGTDSMSVLSSQCYSTVKILTFTEGFFSFSFNLFPVVVLHGAQFENDLGKLLSNNSKQREKKNLLSTRIKVHI